MRQFSYIKPLLLVTAWLGTFNWTAKGDDSISAQDLSGLSQRDRLAVMTAVLERRIDRVQNIEIQSETRTTGWRYANGKLLEKKGEGGWYDFHTRYRHGSYRLEGKFYLHPSSSKPNSTFASHHDEKTGVTRILSDQQGRKVTHGRIGHEHPPSMLSNRVAFHLLGGSFVSSPAIDRCNFLLQSLASCPAKWQIDVNVKEQQVVISHPCTIAFVNTGTGTRKVYFDCVKGMMPVRIDLDYRDEWVTSLEPRRTTPVWLEERIFMTEPKDLGGIWFPMRIEERVRGNALPPDVCTVMTTTLKHLALGGVKEADLPVKFPPDADVADALKQVFYTTGADGEPKGQIHPIGIPPGPITVDPEGNLVVPTRPSWMLRAGLWSAGVGVVLLLGLVVLRRFRASTTQ